MEVLKGAIGSLIEGRLVRAAEQIEATRPESETSGTRPRSLTPRQLWEKLANELLPKRESHVIEASRAAEAMGEPLSASPVRAKAAAKFAGEIVQQYEDMRDYSSEEAIFDRDAFEAAMQEYDREQQRKAEIMQCGVGRLVSSGFAAE